MATASVLARSNNKLLNELGDGKVYKQVKAIPWLSKQFDLTNGAYISIGRTLVKLSREMGVSPKKIDSSEYGSIKAYHIDVINKFKTDVESDASMLEKYRLAA